MSFPATSKPVKVKVEGDRSNDKPAAVLQSKPMIHEVDTTQILKKSEGAIENCSKQWLRIGGIKLTPNDGDAIIDGEKLNNLVINYAQKVLKM